MARIPARLLRMANLALLVAFPIAWAAPLLRAGFLPWFGLSEISILSGIVSLFDSDPALACLVALLALVAPYAKTLALAGVHFGWIGQGILPVLKFLGRLAMADVFLIALYVVAVKGTGLGHVETAWGLWFFTGCVGLSIMLSRVSHA